MSAIVLIDRHEERREMLAASLQTLRAEVSAFGDPDGALREARWGALRVIVLFALERGDQGVVSRVRARCPEATLIAVAPDESDPLGMHPPMALKGREFMSLAQSSGCDGCLFYKSDDEVPRALSALWGVSRP